MLPYLMAGSLIAGFVTAWLQSHPQSTKLPVSDRILKMRKELGMTQRQLAEVAEVSAAAVTQWEKGVNRPAFHAMQNMSQKLQLPMEFFTLDEAPWIPVAEWRNFQGQASTPPSSNEAHTIQQMDADPNINPNPVPVRMMLPVISWVQAGHWTTAETVLRNLPQDTPTLPDIADAGPNGFWLQVQGISNYPEYRHGEYICIDPTWQIDELHTGDMIVATCMGDATFKQLVVEPDGSRYLKALNPDWRPQIMPIGEDCLLVGLVVAKYAPVRRRK